MLQEFERTREEHQVAADQVAGDLFQTTAGILTEQGVPGRKVKAAILDALANRPYKDPNVLDYEELWDIRTVERDCDFGADGTKTVRVRGYGWDKKKNEPQRTFVSVSGLPHLMELQKDHAVMWDITTRGKRSFSHRGSKANIEQVNLYKQVLGKLS